MRSLISLKVPAKENRAPLTMIKAAIASTPQYALV